MKNKLGIIVAGFVFAFGLMVAFLPSIRVANAATGGAFVLPACQTISAISETGNTVTALVSSTTGMTVGGALAVAGVADVRYDGLQTITAVVTNTSVSYTVAASGLSAGAASTDTSFSSAMVCAVPKLIYSSNATLPGAAASTTSAAGPITSYALQDMDATNHAMLFQPEMHTDEPFDLPPSSSLTPISLLGGASNGGTTALYGFSSSTSTTTTVCGGVAGIKR